MPVFRERPYTAFNFLVSLEGFDAGSAQAGFSEISGLDREIEMLEYRAGNDRTGSAQLIPGRNKSVTVTLTRGLIGDATLHEWLTGVTNGSADRRNVRIELLAEDRSSVVQSWRLRNALPVAIHGPVLQAMGNDVAVERLVLMAEAMEIE